MFVIRPWSSSSTSNGSLLPSRVTEMSSGVRRVSGAVGSTRSKSRKMPCLLDSGKSTVSVSVTCSSPSASRTNSAS